MVCISGHGHKYHVFSLCSAGNKGKALYHPGQSCLSQQQGELPKTKGENVCPVNVVRSLEESEGGQNLVHALQ